MKENKKKLGFFFQIKGSNYYKAVEAGFWRIWKNKTIWFWGLFISAGMAMNFNNNKDDSKALIAETANDFWFNYWQFLLIAVIFILIIWIFSTIARAGIIRELNKKQNDKKYILGFRKVWQTGLKRFKRVIGLDLFMLGMFLSILLVNLIVAIPVFLLDSKALSILILGLVILESVLTLIGMVILKSFAQITLLLANLSIKEAWIRSWSIIRNNLRELIKLILTCFAIGLIRSLVFFLFSIVVVSIGGLSYLIISGIGVGTVAETILIGIGIVLSIAVLASVLIISAFFALWQMDILIWWVKMIDGIKTKKKVVKKIVIKNKKVVSRKKIVAEVGA